LLSLFLIAKTIAFAQCQLGIELNNANVTCTNCNNGTASVSVPEGTTFFTYVWTNDVTRASINLIAFKDNSVYEETVTSSNEAGQCLVAGIANAAFRNRALMHFDLAENILLGIDILNAHLQLTVTYVSGALGPQPHTLYKVLQNWAEGTSANNSQFGQGAPATISQLINQAINK
jgi:hypothetical protein